MDTLTEIIILQEADWNRVSTTLKSMIPNIEKVLLRPNVESLKKVAKKLSPRDLRFVHQDAVRRIPGFKKEFSEAQRKVGKLDFVNSINAKAAAMATALVSATTKKDVDGVIKHAEMGVRNAKFLPIPSMTGMIMFSLFVMFCISIYVSEGAIIMPAIKFAVISIGLLLQMIGKILAGIGQGVEQLQAGTEPGVLDSLWQMITSF